MSIIYKIIAIPIIAIPAIHISLKKIFNKRFSDKIFEKAANLPYFITNRYQNLIYTKYNHHNFLNIKNKKIREMIVMRNITYYEFLSEDEKTKELTDNLLDSTLNPHIFSIRDLIKYIPKKYFINKIINDKYKEFEYIIKYVPPKFFTEEICDKIMADPYSLEYTIFKNGKYSLLDMLDYIPFENLDQEILKKHFEKNIKIIKYIPEKCITKEMCDKIINNSKLIKYIPNEFMTYEMCDKIINDSELLKYIPIKNFDKEKIKEYVKMNPTILNNQDIQTQEIVDYAFKINNNNFKLFKDQFKTKDMIDEYTKNNSFELEYIPKQYINETIYEKSINNISNLSLIPTEYYDKINYKIKIDDLGKIFKTHIVNYYYYCGYESNEYNFTEYIKDDNERLQISKKLLEHIDITDKKLNPYDFQGFAFKKEDFIKLFGDLKSYNYIFREDWDKKTTGDTIKIYLDYMGKGSQYTYIEMSISDTYLTERKRKVERIIQEIDKYDFNIFINKNGLTAVI